MILQLFLAIVLFYVIGTNYVNSVSVCPEQGWYNPNSQTCYWLTTVTAGAGTTNSYCSLAGGQLAVFSDQASLDWVRINLGNNLLQLTTIFWIGLTDAGSEGTFTTFKGESAWTSWAVSNPTGVTNKDCVIIDTEDSWSMFDEFCSTLYHGLCSLRLHHCPAGSFYLPSHLVCYWLTPPPARDANANKLLCEENNGTLGVIPNAQVDAEFNNAPLSSIFSGLTGYVYIGVHDNIVEGVEYTYEGNLVTWTKWVPGQPNDYNMPGLPVEDCVKILVDTREWEDEVCTKMLQALCYRNLSSFAATPVIYPTTTTTTTTATSSTTTTTTTTTTSTPDTTTTTPQTTTTMSTTTAPETTTSTETTTTTPGTTTTSTTTPQPAATTEGTQTTEAVTTNKADTNTTVVVPITTGTVNTNQESTTSTVTSGSGIQNGCTCPCETQKTYEELQQQIEEMKKELTIDYKTTSAYIRTKTSVYEDRPVAQNLGIVGITILCVVFGSIILLDIGTFLRQIKNCFRRRSWNV